jgi:hypothetical protein
MAPWSAAMFAVSVKSAAVVETCYRLDDLDQSNLARISTCQRLRDYCSNLGFITRCTRLVLSVIFISQLVIVFASRALSTHKKVRFLVATNDTAENCVSPLTVTYLKVSGNRLYNFLSNFRSCHSKERTWREFPFMLYILTSYSLFFWYIYIYIYI